MCSGRSLGWILVVSLLVGVVCGSEYPMAALTIMTDGLTDTAVFRTTSVSRLFFRTATLPRYSLGHIRERYPESLELRNKKKRGRGRRKFNDNLKETFCRDKKSQDVPSTSRSSWVTTAWIAGRLWSWRLRVPIILHNDRYVEYVLLTEDCSPVWLRSGRIKAASPDGGICWLLSY